jgi:hypothetical protein
MIKAICCGCGAEKSAAIKLCNECGAMPTSHEDRVVSVCLSSDCLKQENLRIARKYIRTKDRLPGFHVKVRREAERIVREMPEDFQLSNSFDLDAVLFEDRFLIED